VTTGAPSISVVRRLVRVLSPKWAIDPSSGAGAAVHGARFNEKGISALYLSFDLEVAANEYGQDLPDRAGTFCHYDVSLSPVADLTSNETLAALALTRADLTVSWKNQLRRNLRPTTWDIADKLIGLGYVGAVYESVLAQNRPPFRATTGNNLVVWKWSTITPNQLVVPLDPDDSLPKNQDSWPPSAASS
jgi:RES domain-containing protein